MKTAKSKLKVIKPSRLVFLIVLVAANTFAWFIYATKIDTNLDVHVKSWNVVFEAGDSQVTDIINLNVDAVYPGMTTYTYSISAYNRSEVGATVSFVILEARILNTTYISQEGRALLGESPVPGDYTSAQLQSKLTNDYPFSIGFSLTGTNLQIGTGVQDFGITIAWPYESNHDDIDTFWGTSAYTYKENNPTEPSIAIKVKITITQTIS